MRLLGLAAALVFCGCAGARVEPGPGPTPALFEPRVLVHVQGSGDVQTFVGALPFSAFTKWSGNGTIEARISATGVVLYLEGDSSWVVTPAPGLEAEAERAVEEGSIVIVRNGRRVGLSHLFVPPPPAPPSAPPPAPPAQPSTPPKEPASSAEDPDLEGPVVFNPCGDGGDGRACRVPR